MAMALEIGAQMVVSDPPDVEGATEFAAEFCIGGFERLSRTGAGVHTLRKTKRRIRTAP
jgi:hypothetical protein